MVDTSNRDHQLTLKLGGSQVSLATFEATETMSGHFEATLTVVSEIDDFDLLAELGNPASVKISLHEQEGELRYFHGVVSEGRHVGSIDELGQIYKIKLSPKALFHDLGRNFRIFQEKTVKEIVTAVLDGCGIEFEYKAEGGTRKRAYCVQYAESDFAFVSRLLEEHGLYYFYKHSAETHLMVICDKIGQHVAGQVPTLLFTTTGQSIEAGDSLLDVSKGYCYQWMECATSTGINRFTIRDYDFKVPSAAREAKHEQQSKHDLDQIEFYDWPGRYYVEAEGNDLAKYQLEANRAQRVTYQGMTTSAGFTVGNKVTLEEHATDRLNCDYLVISAVTKLADETFRSSMGGGDTKVEFVAIRHDVPYRPAPVTPRPKVHGLESAIVTGPADEEIHVDAWGRIKVHFYWDRENPLDDTSSCWLRVSQTGGLGNIIHPRVGQEVLVDFINGDPDRPIVVGRVYNEGLKPFYELPANKTRAVWRTKTYKETSGVNHSEAEDLETGKPGANEIRFEDKTGEEEMFVHAEKDLNTRVRHFETHKVGGNVDIWVGRNRSEEVKVDELIKIGGNRTESVELDEDLTVRNNRKREVFKDEEVKIGSNQTIKVGTDLMIEAGSKITLVCGGSKIEMTPGKIVISSINIEVNATAELKTTSSAKTTITGGGMAEIKAAMVKIN